MFKNINAAAIGVSGHQSEIIELALTNGFQGMDIDIGEIATRVRLHGAAYAKRLLASARLRLGVFALPLDLGCDDATFEKRLQKLSEYCQVAADVGCTRCVTAVSPASDQRPYHENFELHRRRLAEVCKVLAPAGVRLGVGFCAAEYLRKGKAFQFIHDLDALSLLVSMAGSSNLGLLLDVWEVFVAGGTVDAIRKLPVEQIVAVDLANLAAGVSAADSNEDSRLLPGAEDGAIDVGAVLAALAQMGYTGPVTPKPSRNLLKNQRREAVVREVGESLSRVWRAAGLAAPGRPIARSAAC
mgnify:CR=1 FL=1